MVAKKGQNAMDPHKVEVGEIDTSAPFQSVKDAVSLFGEGTFSGERPAIRKVKPHSEERVLAKDTQLHLLQKEINKLKEQLKNAETTKSQALSELENAKITVGDLNGKLKSASESKDSAIKATEAAEGQAKQFVEANNGSLPESDIGTEKPDLEKREQYATVMSALDAAKQELRKIRQDCDASLEEKLAAIHRAAEAENAAKVNMEKVGELSKGISAVHESIGQVKLAALQAQQEHGKIFSEKDIIKQSYKSTLEESTKKLVALRNQFDPEVSRNLESELAETMNEIGDLQKQMENAKASDLNSVNVVTSGLDGAKESLQKVAEEESSLRSLLESLKLELENVRKEHTEVKEKEAETEYIAGNLHVKLRKSKSELEACLAEESKTRGLTEEMIATLRQLSAETENAQREAEEMKNKAEELKNAAEATRIHLEEAEKKLKIATEQAEEAKAAEAKALDQIKTVSETTHAARSSISESGAKITLSRQEFESLSRKVEESDKLSDMKVAAAMAQVEAVRASEFEALQRLEVTQNEIEDMKAATDEALRRAEMAEAAKKAVEGELRRWREREQKKAAEAASRILAETQISAEPSPRHYRIHKQSPTGKNLEVRKLEKERSFISKKVLLPTISGIFHRKKNQIEGGSPSYLPGEKQSGK
jgi:DNA repair exonuclease SbcCD ATPase subunit